MRLLTSLIACAVLVSAGPVEFGMSELNSALAARNLKWRNKAELNLDPPENFRIEPYSYGGANISGGDLRGLMYGLLEAAEQIRTTGRLTKMHGAPTTPLRGVRVVIGPELENASEDFWRLHFQMLARNRFNRAHVVFPRLAPPYKLENLLSRLAADYGIDFTLGIDGNVNAEQLREALTACPGIRSVAVNTSETARAAVFEAVSHAGRRIALDFDGITTVLGEGASLPLVLPWAVWPPSFEIDTPFTPVEASNHQTYYWIWGRLGYDPKTPLPKGADPGEYRTAHDAALWIAAAQQAGQGGSDYVASPDEVARDRAEGFRSAKITPLEIAESLDAAAAKLEQNQIEDFHLLAREARLRAQEQRAAEPTVSLVRVSAPTQWTHKPPVSAPSDQPLTLSIKIAQSKTISSVRLHYRTLDPASKTAILETVSAPEINFTIPASELTGNWDLLYYFEILGPNGRGWFEPDLFSGAPYWIVHIVAPHSGPN